MATIIATGIFYVGAGIGHVYQLVVFGNTAMYNAGPIVYLDLFSPFFLAALLILYHTKKRDAGQDDCIGRYESIGILAHSSNRQVRKLYNPVHKSYLRQ